MGEICWRDAGKVRGEGEEWEMSYKGVTLKRSGSLCLNPASVPLTWMPECQHFKFFISPLRIVL
jgi:hypothetical protein